MSGILSALIPDAPGYLPYWQLLVSVTAIINGLQNFFSMKAARKIYNNVATNEPVTPLQARTFGIWTLTSGVVRWYCAYNIHQKVVYDMTLFTYLLAFAHFSLELLVFRSAKPNPGSMSPVVVSTSSLIWMLTQYDFYVRK
ncbi:Erg28-like protein [Schizophyllum commune Tattone D]|uniref:Erg28-like protein n=1 Tax=Schizophyllum commune (strain H4-8 / FGSC 9210) TaxID=578458 RepID=D8Q5S2_SCHCM|nr:Erg28-like protein [Schizophyllum commune H4-8]KAI4518786.1 Erg28-like protein [Schizophyllum commune Loenen D]KAI5834553.1 Erg28-like protein [Schizophyllum commune Tattone D]KAI5892057.1 Erg28-like protein [Schizophyllum commune H4-8]